MSNTVTRAVELIYTMNSDELNQIVEAIKLKRTHLARSATRALVVGDRVTFQGRRAPVVGTVEKVNRKTALVRSQDGTRWKVTASLLSTC